MCGGTTRLTNSGPSCQGLSPRVRGNHSAPYLPTLGRRSIPACAGEPPTARRALPRSWVYPRVCGGTIEGWNEIEPAGGLSPRVRGNRGFIAKLAVKARSIPACAGEPNPAHPGASARGVYPRVCGGTDGDPGQPPIQWGLSPRVRGNRGCRGRPGKPAGSIPACAGEPG